MRLTRESFELLPVNQILGSNFDLRELIKDIEFSEVQGIITIDE